MNDMYVFWRKQKAHLHSAGGREPRGADRASAHRSSEAGSGQGSLARRWLPSHGFRGRIAMQWARAQSTGTFHLAPSSTP